MSWSDVGQLSSNWKILQERLKAGKKQEPIKSNGLKRKRGLDRSKAIPNGGGIKKVRLSVPDRVTHGAFRRRNMGSYLSTTSNKQAQSPQPEDKTARLVHDYDIDPADITAAYGSNHTTLTRTYSDDINGGFHPSHKIGKYVALDCEMVGTGPPPHDDNVLARASLVNFHGEQIYDSYVQAPPRTTVQDYRTFVSGIKPQHMRAGYARPFAEVQRDVAQLLNGRTLVGHALKNDLSTLQLLQHPKRDLRDTSRYAKFRIESKGKPPALKKLAKAELGLDIQIGEHSSVEDARAAMMLFKKEKAGFEEENRRQFGQGSRGVRHRSQAVDDGEIMENGEEEEDEIDFLDDEVDDEEAGDAVQRTGGAAQPRAKKRKTKKRTKRK